MTTSGAFGKRPKELGKFRPHLVKVSTIGVKKLLFAGRIKLRVVLGRVLERLDVGEPQLFGNGQQLLFIFLYLVDADLVNLIRRHVGSGALLHQKAVIGIAIGQSPYPGIAAAAGDVLRF